MQSPHPLCFRHPRRWPSARPIAALLSTAVWLLGASAWAQADGTVGHSPSTRGTRPDDAVLWRQANEAVARFPRGHADVLKAEANLNIPPHRPALPGLVDPQRLLRHALLQRPDLWAAPADNPVTRRKRQQAIAGWSRDLMQAWWQAAAAREEALLAADQAESARLAAELANRMARVGNWSEQRRLQHLNLYLAAQQEADAAQHLSLDSHQTLHRLARAGTTAGAQSAFGVQQLPVPETAANEPAVVDWAQIPLQPEPAELQQALDGLAQRPDWQASHAAHTRSQLSLPPMAWEQLLDKLTQHVPTPPAQTSLFLAPPEIAREAMGAIKGMEHAWHNAAAFQALASRLEAQTRQAWLRLQLTHTTLTRITTQALPTAKQLESEAQKRANGMLVSTWDVLAAQRNRVEAERAQVRAVLDWQQAWLDWQAVLAGADPALQPLTAGASGANTNPEGH